MFNWKNKKVLVTGADGFIGSHLVECLLERGTKVKAFIYYNAFNHWGWLDSFSIDQLKKVNIFAGDIRDQNSVYKAVEGIDIIFHLAALIGIPFSYHSPGSYVDTNVKGTLNILQAAKKEKIEKMVHTSTSEVYGSAQYVPINESHPICPQSPYAASKSAADDLALSFYHSFDVPVTLLRPFNTYGPRQSARAIIPTIITQLYSGQKTIKLGHVDTIRDFAYVRDIVEAFLKVVETNGTNGEIFNAGSNRAIKISELVSLLRRITGRKAKIVREKERLRPPKSEVDRLICSPDKLHASCGWKCRMPLEEGLVKTCRWIKQNLKYYKPKIYNI